MTDIPLVGQPILIPLGWDLGDRWSDDGDPVTRRIRFGATVHDISTDLMIAWEASGSGIRGLTDRASVSAAAGAAGLAAPDRAIDQLRERGLVAEVDPDGSGALSFASTVRLRPLLPLAELPPHAAPGHPVSAGDPVIDNLDALLFSVYDDAALTASLLSNVTVSARTAIDAGLSSVTARTPELVLREVLLRLPGLVSRRVVAVDAAWERP